MAAPDGFADLWSSDRAAQNAAYAAMMEATGRRVDWAYDVWADVVANLKHPDNHNRAIAAQLLANLAASDPERRILRDLDALVAVSRDERFVTARHALKALWRTGVSGEEQRVRLLALLDQRFTDAAAERNGTLVRFDIVESLRHLYDATGDEAVCTVALELVGREADPKYRKKYAAAWR